LNVSKTSLQSLDVSKCTQLQYLDVSDTTSLQSLDVSKCTQLTNLDVSNTQKITYLDVSNTQITYLDVSNCTQLTVFNIFHSKIDIDTSFNTQKNTLLQSLPTNNISSKYVYMTNNDNVTKETLDYLRTNDWTYY
jgi:hypothetical protein